MQYRRRDLFAMGGVLTCLVVVAPAGAVSRRVRPRRSGVVDTYAKSYEVITDQIATSILKQYQALERDHVALLTSYLPRFQKVLPPIEVARL
jgi:hypothetical protein